MNDWLATPCRVPDDDVAAAATRRQARLTKPAGSLGRMEDLAVQLAGLQGRERPTAGRVWIAVFTADHGVAVEGISAYPQAVTGEMLRNFASGGAAIAVLARELDATLDVVNLGTVNDPGDVPGVLRRVIAPSTANIVTHDAMTTEQLDAALAEGEASVRRSLAAGTDIFIGGDMGIGNTTSASALACALLGAAPDTLAGAGTGLDAVGIARKTDVIARALHRHSDADTPLEWLRRLGGFEIAALTGAFVAAAQHGVPVLVDGHIASVAALAAVALRPDARPWLLFAHRSHERGHARVLAALDAEPLLDLSLRLGEASGAAIAVPLLRLACALHGSMATFAEAGVSEA
ncbi:nicotinate-nucleotide-dimethylbenzimidazole phosphoribosyltransferase [Luteibacter sp. UNC138MFCol5.1]|uniref:nicotinate-nucleotide--dimethylbenzimidazole phosphoribosyltransferase n=1 Tax=Luteibacter sp. UNC138MFCol5.1 TaxID=1502774 RepID=UPI0008AC4812|nr:nicotinate-nucleotide--dimethylbenzimidazole phosphoribosyltransferase [Luteibacter sp. UNC138MFCol5.1]SEO41977.1 nicotinate-nucleotide-dimethylbenzimidazole phosphoribosyltransferase [Luteibacter sp. UNC138MFCol5.1]